MIAEAGLAALWFAGALAALQLILAILGIARSSPAVRPEFVEGATFSWEEENGASRPSARTEAEDASARILAAMPGINGYHYAVGFFEPSRFIGNR